jgi:hypothetical protein
VGLARRLETLDRRWIFLAVGIAVMIPLIVRIGFKIVPSRYVVQYYRAIEDLPEGGVVYLATDFDPSVIPELYPMLESTIRHCCRKNLRIISGSLWAQAPPMVDQAWRDVGERECGKREGTDFVDLGFKEGREAVMVRLGNSIRDTYPLDARGRPISAIPVMKGIRNFDQVDLLVNISGGYPGTKEWVQQVRTRFNVPIVAGVTAVSGPEFYPYLQTGQLDGMLGGLAGAAEYEKLLNHEGDATRGMDAQSLGHLTMLLFIVVGNLLYLGKLRRGQP